MDAEAPVTHSQTRIVRDHFDEWGEQWDDRYKRRPRGMPDLDLQLRRESVHILLKGLSAVSADRLLVLDLGCGVGSVLDGFSRERIAVVATDLSGEMVSAAARLHPADQHFVTDAAHLPVGMSTFDVVVCVGMLEYVPDVNQVLQQVTRALRPGGRLIASFPNRNSVFRTLLALERAAERIAIKGMDLLSGRTRDLTSYAHTSWSPRSVFDLLRRHGLETELVRFTTIGPYGRLGRLRLSIEVARRLSRAFEGRGMAASRLATTMVIQAKRASRVSNTSGNEEGVATIGAGGLLS
ncbi:MAG: hypothetical protein AMXMBFR13_01030 [Phycisphaerae bacterium]